MRRQKGLGKRVIICLGGFIGLALPGVPARADIPSKLEPGYSKAILDINDRRYGKALNELNAVLAEDPNLVEALEAKAAVLKLIQQEGEAEGVYRSLVKIKTASHAPASEIAPYYFELGMIRYHQNQLVQAHADLNAALRGGFHPELANFFLGTVDFKQKLYAEAETHFSDVIRSPASDLKPASHFYIAQIESAAGRSSEAAQAYVEAEKSSEEAMENTSLAEEVRQTAKDIFHRSEQALVPYRKSGFFGNIAVLSGYDSNVLAVPDAQAATANGGTGRSSGTSALQAGIGYMNSPLADFQFVPSYKMGLNYNFNTGVELGDFFTHDLSLYVTRHSMEETSWGGKIEAVYTFQNELNVVTAKSSFQPYSLVWSVGPYFKTKLSRAWSLSAEAFALPQTNYTDTNLSPDLRRSGFEETARLSLRNETFRTYWNPGFAVYGDNNSTNGTEFKSLTFGAEINDTMSIRDTDSLYWVGSVGLASYGSRPAGAREDTTLALGVNWMHQLSRSISLLANLSYLDNLSNVVDVYQYTRINASGGVSYRF